MEIVPFSANVAGLALAALGLAPIAHDGVLAIGAFVGTAATFGAVGRVPIGRARIRGARGSARGR